MKTTDTNLWQSEPPRYLREFPDYDTDDDEIAQPLLSTNDWREVEACALKAAAKLELEWRKRMC